MNTTTRRAVATALLFALAGCVGPIEIAPLPYAHPANPTAPAGTLPPLGSELPPARLPRSGPPDEAAGEIARPGEVTAAGKYQCPMHPAVRSDKPGRCPICGMKLVETDNTARPHDGEHEL